MILAVDIGNTGISLGLFRLGEEKPQGSLIFRSKITTDVQKSADEYAVLLHSVFALRGACVTDVTAIVIGSVVPQLTDVIRSALASVTQAAVYTVGPGLKTGVNIQTDDPSELGADIVANAVGGLFHAEPPMILVDVGTATSVFAVNEQKAVIGGCIAPGLKVSTDALRTHASRLPAVSLIAPLSVIGKNTDDAMRAGALFGHAMMIDGMIDAFAEAMKTELPTVLLTGGLSSAVLPLLRHEVTYVESLTLEGLCGIYMHNEKKNKRERKHI